MSKRIPALLLLFALAFTLFSCTPSLIKHQKTAYGLFDTVITLTGYAPDDGSFDEACAIVFDVLKAYNKLTDIYYDYDGVVNCKTVNDHAGGEPVAVSQTLFDYLRFAKEMAQKTNGACDLMLGAVTRLWKTASSTLVLPDENVLAEAMTHCGYALLELNETDCTVAILDKDASLDVGATAKGYAVEMAMNALTEAGYTGYLLDAGGNLRTVGQKPDGAFLVGVKNPDGGTLTKTHLTDSALVTSGTYNQTFTIDGKTYHHIVDGKTGYPTTAYRSLTVYHPSSAVADALSTALFVLDETERQAVTDAFPDCAYYGVTADGTVFFSQNFPDEG